MTYTSCFALYHIARNNKVQELLYKEACSLLPSNDTPVTSEILSCASYTKAVIKETFRLNPIAVGVGRILHKDAILSGYHVPSGVSIVLISFLKSCIRHTIGPSYPHSSCY